MACGFLFGSGSTTTRRGKEGSMCEAFCLDTLDNSRFFVALVVELFANSGDEEGSLLLSESVARPTRTTTRASKLTMDPIQRGLCSLLVRHVAAAVEVIVEDCRF